MRSSFFRFSGATLCFWYTSGLQEIVASQISSQKLPTFTKKIMSLRDSSPGTSAWENLLSFFYYQSFQSRTHPIQAFNGLNGRNIPRFHPSNKSKPIPTNTPQKKIAKPSTPTHKKLPVPGSCRFPKNFDFHFVLFDCCCEIQDDQTSSMKAPKHCWVRKKFVGKKGSI